MPATRHCHNCGEPWMLNGQPGRGETCLKCRADLRVCLNCAHYDPRVAQQCRESRAEPVLEKHTGTFCEYFEFARRDWMPKAAGDSREAKAREQLKKLFGDCCAGKNLERRRALVLTVAREQNAHHFLQAGKNSDSTGSLRRHTADDLLAGQGAG